MGCRFCGFAKRKEDKGSEWLEPAQVVERTAGLGSWWYGSLYSGWSTSKMEGNY